MVDSGSSEMSAIEDERERSSREPDAERAIVELQFLIENAPSWLWAASRDGRLDFITAQAARFTGHDNLINGWSWLDVIHPDERDEARERWANAVENCAPIAAAQRIRRADGTYVPFLVRCIPVRDHDGHVTRYVGTAVELSEVLESNGRDREELLESIGDDIESPTNEILSIAEQMLASATTADQRHLLQTLESAANNLRGLADDLHEAARLEADDLQLTVAPFSLRALLSETMRGLLSTLKRARCRARQSGAFDRSRRRRRRRRSLEACGNDAPRDGAAFHERWSAPRRPPGGSSRCACWSPGHHFRSGASCAAGFSRKTGAHVRPRPVKRGLQHGERTRLGHDCAARIVAGRLRVRRGFGRRHDSIDVLYATHQAAD